MNTINGKLNNWPIKNRLRNVNYYFQLHMCINILKYRLKSAPLYKSCFENFCQSDLDECQGIIAHYDIFLECLLKKIVIGKIKTIIIFLTNQYVK